MLILRGGLHTYALSFCVVSLESENFTRKYVNPILALEPFNNNEL
jgi:hypothetical protein